MQAPGGAVYIWLMTPVTLSRIHLRTMQSGALKRECQDERCCTEWLVRESKDSKGSREAGMLIRGSTQWHPAIRSAAMVVAPSITSATWCGPSATHLKSCWEVIAFSQSTASAEPEPVSRLPKIKCTGVEP
jgi:hypothetical protein